MPAEKVITPLAEDSPRKTAAPSRKLPAIRPAEAEIRIHRDGLLIAKCNAVGMGSGIL